MPCTSQSAHSTCRAQIVECATLHATPHISQSPHFIRQPPYGGRRAERADCEMRGAATMEC
eukprot:76554-Lingulodinium_polyedra.AAC.1